MNIVFYLLIVVAIVVFWFLLAFVFKPFGRILYRIFKDTQDVLNEDEAQDTSNGNENNERRN